MYILTRWVLLAARKYDRVVINGMGLVAFGLCSSRVFTYWVFLTYAAALSVLQREWGMSAAAAGGAYIVGLFHLMGMLASLSTGTLSDRLSRTSVILLVASISTACSFVMGWLIGFSILLIAAVGMIYAFSAIGDSPILSAGLTENALPLIWEPHLQCGAFSGSAPALFRPLSSAAFWTGLIRRIQRLVSMRRGVGLIVCWA